MVRLLLQCQDLASVTTFIDRTCCTDFGVERVVPVDGLDDKAIESKLQELVQTGERMPRFAHALSVPQRQITSALYAVLTALLVMQVNRKSRQHSCMTIARYTGYACRKAQRLFLPSVNLHQLSPLHTSLRGLGWSNNLIVKPEYFA